MKSRKLYDAFGYVEDQYLDMVDTPEKEITEMKKNKHISVRRAVTFILAAALCVSILGVTAMAAGWIPNIFASLKEEYPEEKELFEAAAEANTTAQPITVTVEIPEVDGSSLTLFEKYYDGQTILLGYNLAEILPEPVVGYTPDEALLQELKGDPGRYAYTYTEDGNDSLDHYLETGLIDREHYNSVLDNRTENAKKYDLRNENNILMDHALKQQLSEKDYNAFWNQLVTSGFGCVVMQEVHIGDHKYVNGADMSETYDPETNPNMGMVEYEAEGGSCLKLSPLPAAGQDQETVTVDLTLNSNTIYLYMELEGHAYMRYLRNESQDVSFTLENISNS